MADSRHVVGAHVAPEHPLDEAAALGADCVQVFLTDPQGFAKPPPRPDAEELRPASSGCRKAFVVGFLGATPS